MGKYFGTDGFRGEANSKLRMEHAVKVGRFLGWYFGREHKAKILIGMDTRISGPMFESALCAGITASGADAYLLHVTTTPSVAYLVRTEGFDCGIMISASHNPYYDNGLKVINCRGHKMEAEVEAKIEEYMDGLTEELPLATGDQIGRTVEYAEGIEKYTDMLVSIAKEAGYSYEGVKVGLDCANGSSSAIAENVFKTLGAETFAIHHTPDGVNINTNCGSTHIEVLQQYVKENGLDLGFAFDGDADRCIAVDGNGEVVNGDLILYVCGKYLKEQGRLFGDAIVTTVMSNLGLYKACDKIGMHYEKTNVGDKYVYENMVKNGFELGGEQSGHVIFSSHATTGDGIMTALMVMEAVLAKKSTLAELAGEVQIFPQLLKNLRVGDMDATLNHPLVQETIAGVEAELGENGRVLVRKSGTEPLLRVMVEALTDEICEKCVETILDSMKKVQ